jgi:hypothetical protein
MVQRANDLMAHVYRLYARYRPWLLVAALAVLAVYSARLVIVNTELNGIGLRSDSVRYIWGAENFAKGIGIGRLSGDKQFKPTTHWPPLYPIALAGFIRVGLSGLEAARWFAALVTGLLLFTTGIYIYRLTNNSLWFAVLGTGLVFTMPHFWETNLYAMTEAVFMVWCLLALFFLDLYLSSQKSAWLIASILMQAFAFLTRYVGGALLIACAVILLLQPGWTMRRKFRDIFVMFFFASLPILFWFIRNELTSDTATNRTLALIPISAQEWVGFGGALRDWFNPFFDLTTSSPLRLFLFLGVGSVIGLFIFWYGRSEVRNSNSRLWLLTLVFGVCYAFLTVVARLLFDRDIPLSEQRILYPSFVSFFCLILYGLHRLQQVTKRLNVVIPVLMAGVLLASAWAIGRGYFKESASILKKVSESGLGVASTAVWKIGFIPLVNTYPYDYTYFSDDLDRLYYVSGRPSHQINFANPAEMPQLTSKLDNRNVVIVLFHPAEIKPILDLIPGLKKVYDAEDGAVYINFSPSE